MHTFQPNSEERNEEEFGNVAAVVLYGLGTLFSLQLESLHGMAISICADNRLLLDILLRHQRLFQ